MTLNLTASQDELKEVSKSCCLVNEDVLQDCQLRIFEDNLPSNAPIGLCIGECGEAVYLGGVRTLQLTCNTSHSTGSVLDVARNVFKDIFSSAKENHSKGVYLVGLGFGAFVAAKLLSDHQFFKENSPGNLFQAAYLISGLYNVTKDIIPDLNDINEQKCEKKSCCQSSPRDIKRHNSLIDYLVRDKSSFDDRKNLSVVCDLSHKDTFYGEVFTDDIGKSKQFHGIYKYMYNYEKDSQRSEDVEKSLNESEDSLNFVDDFELFKSFSDEHDEISTLNDDYSHLCSMDVRLYVFAGENDCLEVRNQSRSMYDQISNNCYTGNMHFQIQDKLDIVGMKKLFRKEDNFIKKLIRYDVVKHL